MKVRYSYAVQVKLEEFQHNSNELETNVKQEPDKRKQQIYDPEYMSEDLDAVVETKEEEESGDDSDAPLIDTLKRVRATTATVSKKRLKKSSSKKVELPTPPCCCLCQAPVTNENELKSHVDSFHPTEIQEFLRTKYNKYTLRHKYECEFCHRKYTRKGSIEKHFEVPEYEEPPRKRYGGSKKKVKTGDNGAVCTVCGKMYYDKYDLELHELRIHATEKPIACPHPGCHKRFAAEKLMRKHFRFHGERKHICEVIYV